LPHLQFTTQVELLSWKRNGLGEDPRALASELPLLLYPLGDLDDDPEDLLTFLGVTCVAQATAGFPLHRAQVTIDFFALNDREELWRGRAETLRNVYLALAVLNDPGSGHRAKQVADQRLREMLSPQSEHTNCARSFRRLYQQDSQLAGELADKAQAYLDSES
jgi:hypothetical protein